jgi:calcineurin-like phosphoesterase family protein
VNDEDIVYHLGDVYFNQGSTALSKLKGRKRLVLGNHDNGKAKALQENFQKITSERWFAEHKTILTHRPALLPQFDDRMKYNIHGHLHQNDPPSNYHFNVSVERIGYRPIDLDQVLHELGEM